MHFKIAFNVLCFVKLSNWINLLPWWTENSKDPKSGFLGYSHSKLALEYGESCGDFSFCCCLFVCGNDVLVWFSLLLYFLLYQSIIYSKNTSSTLLAKLAMSNCSDGSKEWRPAVSTGGIVSFFPGESSLAECTQLHQGYSKREWFSPGCIHIAWPEVKIHLWTKKTLHQTWGSQPVSQKLALATCLPYIN